MSGPTELLEKEPGQSFDNADYLILSEESGEINKEDAKKKIDEAWTRTSWLSFWQRVLAAFFPR
jgi:hypothetical protein